MTITDKIEWVTTETIESEQIVNLFFSRGRLVQAYVGDTAPCVDYLLAIALKIDSDILWLGEARSEEAYQEYMKEQKTMVLDFTPRIDCSEGIHSCN